MSTALFDVWLVARFEFLRAVRTWRALALLVLYAVATLGAVLIFSQVVLALEENVALTIGAVPPTRPGRLIGEVMSNDATRRVLSRLAGGRDVIDELLAYSPLALFHLWFSLLLAPFFAATAAAESIAIDVQSRAIRFEVSRTGRAEVVFGRFFGQALLVGLASVLAIGATWGVGALYFVDQELGVLGVQLGWVSLRAWAFALPFVALGTVASTLTASPAWARVMGVGAVCGTWVLTWAARYYRDRDWGLAMDFLLNLLPQGWMRTMWAFDGAWSGAALACVVLSIAITGLGALRFERRDV